MSRLDEVITKGIELKNAINRLNEETKVLNSIVLEKRKIKYEEVLNDLMKYKDIMESLNIKTVCLSTKYCMVYRGLSRRMGIELDIWEYNRRSVMQIDLGLCSNVMGGFYSKHSIGVVRSGFKNEEILNGFCKYWDRIKKVIDESFSIEVEKILQERKEKAINDKEKAIEALISIR